LTLRSAHRRDLGVTRGIEFAVFPRKKRPIRASDARSVQGFENHVFPR
jgi:hypothetical protein